MRPLLLLILTFLAGPALAQTACVNNTDASGNVCTSFTLGTHPLANGCQNVVAQDGQPAWGGVCANGFYNEGTLDIQLQHDPTNGGQELFAPGCTSTVVSNTEPAPAYQAPTQQPPGSVVVSFACTTTNYFWDGSTFTDNWVGTFEVDYVSQYKVHCSSGRAGHCVHGYDAVQTGGSGEMSTPPPPLPPPPPPQPVEYDMTLLANLCDAAFDCVLQPTDPAAVVQTAVLFASTGELYVQNANGTVDAVALDYLSITQQGDDSPGGGDPIPYAVTGQGEVYDPNTGALLKTDSFALNVVQDPQGNVTLSSGTLTIIVQPPTL